MSQVSQIREINFYRVLIIPLESLPGGASLYITASYIEKILNNVRGQDSIIQRGSDLGTEDGYQRIPSLINTCLIENCTRILSISLNWDHILDKDIQILLNIMLDKLVLEQDEEVEPSNQQLLDGLLDGPLDGLLIANNSFIIPNTFLNL